MIPPTVDDLKHFRSMVRRILLEFRKHQSSFKSCNPAKLLFEECLSKVHVLIS